MGWYGYKPYVSAAERKRQALAEMEKLRKKGVAIQPVTIQGMKIAKQFWGKAWCTHMESFGDFSNRLPRGRTYARNGSICHLGIKKGEIEAFVSGSSLYKVQISIATLPKKKWETVKAGCSGEISSLLSLLQGKIPDRVMELVTNQQDGLFPSPKEIRFSCSCPDYASMCKHIAAVFYGIGARLDVNPELLFELRGVDHEELISSEADLTTATGKASRNRISLDALGDVFGIDLDEAGEATPAPKPAATKKAAGSAQKSTDTAGKAGHFTGPEIIELRQKFGMNQTEFALLLGVSSPTVSKWEKSRGPLKLQSYSEKELKAARKFTKDQAWKRLETIL